MGNGKENVEKTTPTMNTACANGNLRTKVLAFNTPFGAKNAVLRVNLPRMWVAAIGAHPLLTGGQLHSECRFHIVQTVLATHLFLIQIVKRGKDEKIKGLTIPRG